MHYMASTAPTYRQKIGISGSSIYTVHIITSAA